MPPCRLHVTNAGYRQCSAGRAQARNTKSLLVSSMPRLDKLHAIWDETGSEEEESGSYNISFPSLPSSEDDSQRPSPSQHKHAMLVKMLESLPRDSPSAEESDEEEGEHILFSHFWEKLIS